MDDGVMALDLGEGSSWLGGSCCDPGWRVVKAEAEEEFEELFRLLTSRLEEVRTEEKVEANGDVAEVLSEVLSLREGEAIDKGCATFVDSGARPRREVDG